MYIAEMRSTQNILHVKMLYLLLIFPFVILCSFHVQAKIKCFRQDFRQEKARIVSFNPDYIKDARMVSGRRGRNDIIYTNMTLTTLGPSGNNVSVAITLQMISGGDFRLSHKLCDIMKEIWIVNFMKAYSDLNSTCPFPAGTYYMFNMVIPPKNMPIPMIASDYNIIIELYGTKSKEQILKALFALRYEKTKWSSAAS